MNPIPKISLIMLSVFLMAPPIFAQQSEDWVQENWQRVSGEVDNFQEQFPSQNSGVNQAGLQSSGHGNALVRHADHQSDIGPVHMAAASHGVEGMEMIGDPVAALDSEMMGPSGWTGDLAGQFNKIDWPKVASSLAVVLGAYFGFVWLMRKMNPKMNGGLPSEVFELIGTTRLNTKQTLQLVRLGSKLLLLVHGDEGTHPIAEITDPGEVEHLTELCSNRSSGRRRSAETSSRPTGFRGALNRAHREGDSTEAAMDKVIRKLSELAGKANRTDFEA